MSEIVLDHAAAVRELARVIADGDEQLRAHQSRMPELAASAAGRDFADRGAAIGQMLQRLHSVGRQRIDAVLSTAEAAAAQVRVFRDVDESLADSFGRPR